MIITYSVCITCRGRDIYSIYVAKAHKALVEKRNSEAIFFSDKAISISPEHYVPWLIKGRALYENDRYDSAIRMFNKAIELDSKNTSAFYYKGLCFYDLDKYDSAIANLNLSIKTKGSDSTYIEFHSNGNSTSYNSDVPMAEIHFFRALAFYHKRNLGSSFKDFAYAAADNFELGKSYYYMGLIGIESGKMNLGCKYLLLSYNNNFKDAKPKLKLYCQ